MSSSPRSPSKTPGSPKSWAPPVSPKGHLNHIETYSGDDAPETKVPAHLIVGSPTAAPKSPQCRSPTARILSPGGERGRLAALRSPPNRRRSVDGSPTTEYRELKKDGITQDNDPRSPRAPGFSKLAKPRMSLPSPLSLFRKPNAAPMPDGGLVLTIGKGKTTKFMMNPPPSPSKQCAVQGCTQRRFARGYCALHLSAAASPETPTSRTRKRYNMFRRTQEKVSASETRVKWHFVFPSDEHTLELVHDTETGECVVYVDERQQSKGVVKKTALPATFCVPLPASPVSVSAMVGQDKTSGEWTYDLDINGRCFADARNLFLRRVSLAELNLRQKLTPQQILEQLKSMPEGQESTEMEEVERNYIAKHWTRTDTNERKKFGASVRVVVWTFTVQGRRHEVVLEHEAMDSGKRKVMADGDLVNEERVGGKSASVDFTVASLPCSVTIKRNEKVAAHAPTQSDDNASWAKAKEEADKSQGSEDSDGEGAETEPVTDPSSSPWLYDLIIDRVPFEQCKATVYDLGADAVQAMKRKSVVEAKKESKESKENGAAKK